MHCWILYHEQVQPACFEQQFSSVYREDAQSFNEVAYDGDNVIFYVCLILNIAVWPKLDHNKDDEDVLEKQLKRVNQIYYQLKAFSVVIEEERTNSFTYFARYASQYFNTKDG